MKNKIILIAILSLILVPFYSIAVESDSNTLYYYWGNGCPHCAKVEPLIDSLPEKYPSLKVIKKEIWYNQSNALEFSRTVEDLNVPDSQRGVPFVKMGNDYLVGDQQIIDGVDNLIKKHLNATSSQVQNETTKKSDSSKFSFWAITGAALADSVNPCAIAVLIILLSALMLANKKERALKSGISFIVGVYLAYFLLGIGLLYVIKSIPAISGVIYHIVGAIAVIIGLANIKDFFWYGGAGFVTEIPRKWRPTMKKVLEKGTSPISAFLIGLIITMFELPCTGGPYLFTIGLLSKGIAWSAIYAWLLYYNVIFILPLISILAIIYFGYASVKRVSELRQKNIRVLHLIAGLIMLVLGIWVLII